MLLGIGDGVERRLRVAGAGEHPGEVARLGRASRARSASEMRLDQPEEGAPGFHRGAEIVHRDGLDALAVLHRGPALGENVAGDLPQRLSDRLLAAANPACRSCDSYMTASVTV